MVIKKFIAVEFYDKACNQESPGQLSGCYWLHINTPMALLWLLLAVSVERRSSGGAMAEWTGICTLCKLHPQRGLSHASPQRMARCAAGISRTGLRTELVEMPIHFNWNLCWKLATLQKKKKSSLFQGRLSGLPRGSSLTAFSISNDCSDPKWVVILG